MPNKSPPLEDQWAWNLIGTPFPDNPVHGPQQANGIVCLWYKHGKPCHGKAMNNGGVVECSIPYPLSKLELCDRRDLGGQIQILQYTQDSGGHLKCGYWYNWIKVQDRPKENTKDRELVRCGMSAPIIWLNRPEGALMGMLDLESETAQFGLAGKCVSKKGDEIKDMQIIVRELKGGPPTCACAECKVAPPKPGPRVMLNEWRDYRAGDPWPQGEAVKGLDRALNTLPGEVAEQYVALWYQQGEPVMGRVWNDNGKIAACFSWGGHEYRNNIGSLQILFHLPEHVRGFDYSWVDYPKAAVFGEKEWHPVHVDQFRGDISPGVLIIDGKELLGKIDVRNERASAGHKGEEKVQQAGAVQSCKVLCRKARPGQKFD